VQIDQGILALLESAWAHHERCAESRLRDRVPRYDCQPRPLRVHQHRERFASRTMEALVRRLRRQQEHHLLLPQLADGLQAVLELPGGVPQPLILESTGFRLVHELAAHPGEQHAPRADREGSVTPCRCGCTISML
jgi:hypothetical protein